MTYDAAIAVLREWSPLKVGDLNLLARLAKIHSHPDRNGGDHDGWNQVQQALQTIDRKRGKQ